METKIVALLGPSDAGKTTITESLLKVKISKYHREISGGLTLKVGYGQREIEGVNYYLLDSPGHKSLSSEALRNLDLVDLALYIVDGSLSRNTKRYEYALSYYQNISKTLEFYNIPFILCINKAESVESEDLIQIYNDHKKVCKSFFSAVPISARSEEGFCSLEPLLKKIQNREITKDPSLKYRVIKSFNVNKTGSILNSFKGGVLGCYTTDSSFTDDLETSKLLSHSNVFYNDLSKISIIKTNIHNEKIVTLETLMDPSLTRNDLQKGTLILNFEKLDRANLALQGPLEITLKFLDRPLIKGEKVLVIVLGQLIEATVKKDYKTPQGVVLNLSLARQRGVKYIPFNSPMIVLGESLGEQKVLACGFKKN